jgi:hypothetical protein
MDVAVVEVFVPAKPVAPPPIERETMSLPVFVVKAVGT